MKRMILATAVMIITTVNVFAQDGKTQRKSPEERTEKIVAKMKMDLVLTDDQVQKVKPVILKREQQRNELHAKMDAAKKDSREVRKTSEEELTMILTPEQMEKLKTQRKKMHEKGKRKEVKTK